MGNRRGSAAAAPGHKAPAEGADNNTRLAFLEGSTVRLALAISDAGIELQEGQDPIEQAIAIVGNWKSKMLSTAAIAAYLAANPVEGETGDVVEDLVIARLEAAAKADGNATEGEIAAIARADAAEAKVKELETEIVELNNDVEEAANERNQARNELQAFKEGRPPEAAAEDEAEEEAEVVAPAPAVRPETARDVGPTFAQGEAKDIAQILADGSHELELAYSNGDYELIEFGPHPIDAGVLVFRGQKFHVEPAIHLRGGAADVDLHGVALIVDGEQFAYCQFPEPQAIASRSERKLERMILFG